MTSTTKKLLRSYSALLIVASMATIAYGFALQLYWHWFVKPIAGIISDIGLAQAIGLTVLMFESPPVLLGKQLFAADFNPVHPTYVNAIVYDVTVQLITACVLMALGWLLSLAM